MRMFLHPVNQKFEGYFGVTKKIVLFVLANALGLLLIYNLIEIRGIRFAVALVWASVSLLFIFDAGPTAILKTVLFLSCVPVIPEVLQGIPLSCFLVLALLAITTLKPTNIPIAKNNFAVIFQVSIVISAISFAYFSGLAYGYSSVADLITWITGLIFVLMCSSGKLQFLITKGEAVLWIMRGQLTALLLGQIFYFYPSLSLPGVSSVGFTKFQILSQQAARFSGIFPDYELYAQYCLVAIVFAFAHLLQAGAHKLLSATILLLAWIQIILTGTRSSIILAVCASIYIVLSVARSQRAKETPVLIFSILLLAAAIVTVIFRRLGSLGGIGDRLNPLLANPISVFENDRVDIWIPYWETAKLGLIKLPEYVTFPYRELGSPHSLPLSLTLALGLIPTLTFFSIYIKGVLLSLRAGNEVVRLSVPLALMMLLIDQLKVEGVRLNSFWIFVLVLIAVSLYREDESFMVSKSNSL